MLFSNPKKGNKKRREQKQREIAQAKAELRREHDIGTGKVKKTKNAGSESDSDTDLTGFDEVGLPPNYPDKILANIAKGKAPLASDNSDIDMNSENESPQGSPRYERAKQKLL
jgi:hypothetical protein